MLLHWYILVLTILAVCFTLHLCSIKHQHKGEKDMAQTISKCSSKRLAIAILLAMTLVITQLAVPVTAFAKTANYDSYKGVKVNKYIANISPGVYHTTTIKDNNQTNKKITYYTNSFNAYSSVAPVVGQKLTVGFPTDKNESKASKAAFKKLKNAVSIKKVTWYTKSAKGTNTVISTKKTLTVPKSAVGKFLYCEYSWTFKGLPGVRTNVVLLNSDQPKSRTSSGEYKYEYVPVLQSGALSTEVTVTAKDNKLTAVPKTTFNKRYGEKAKNIKPTYKYQWYKHTYNSKTGNSKYTKINGATKKTYTAPKATEGTYVVFVTASKKNYSSTFSDARYFYSPPAPPVTPDPADPATP